MVQFVISTGWVKKKVWSRNIIVFHELLSLGCINCQNLCAHHQEELMTIPKHPQLSKFGWFWAKLWPFEKKRCFEIIKDLLVFGTKMVNQNYFQKLLFSLDCHNLAQNHPNFTSWGCFGNLRTSSWWWAHRFLKLMHPRLSNSWKTIMFRDPTFFWLTL